MNYHKNIWKCHWIPQIDEERYMELGGVFFPLMYIIMWMDCMLALFELLNNFALFLTYWFCL